jgi:hypothetical protein
MIESLNIVVKRLPHLLCTFGSYWVQILAQRITTVIEVSRGFPQSLRANARIVHQIRPQPLPSRSFPFIHSLIILLFNAT